MKSVVNTLVGFLCLSLVFFTANASQAQGSLGPVAITAGGGSSAGSGSIMLASVGQPLAGVSTGLRAGLWYSIGAAGAGGNVGTDVETDEPAIPTQFRLHQNYPNPFNPSTTIQYDIAEHGPVELVVMNMLGHRVARLHSGDKPAGTYTVTWDARDDTGRAVASGLYVYRLSTPGFVQTRSMLLVK